LVRVFFIAPSTETGLEVSWRYIPIARYREDRCAVGLACVAIQRSDGVTISGDLLATHLPSFMCLMPIAVRTPTVPSSHMVALCEHVPRAGVSEFLQLAEPKEAVV
jgi:hypothetical protein